MQPMNRLRIKRMNKKKQCEFQNSIENHGSTSSNIDK